MSALPLDDQWLPLQRDTTPLRVDITVGDIAREAAAKFDYQPPTTGTHTPWMPPLLPDNWQLGVIVGASGSGKSTMLSQFGAIARHQWSDTQSIADHFPDTQTAMDVLYAVGLSSVPTWMKPYRVLSVGEKFRADLARDLVEQSPVVDEFTSTVDRNVARAASVTFAKWTRRSTAAVVIASVHRDVLPWLQPDWVADLDAGMYALRPRECLQRPDMVVDIYEVDRAMWARFVEHHYLSEGLHPFARCYIATLDGQPAAFAAAIPFPHGRISNGWRGTRLVTLPDFQGLGIGPRLADWVAEAHHMAGYAYYAKTTHARLGEWREASPLWSSTTHNKRKRPGRHDAPVSFGTRTVKPWVGSTRSSYSHKFTGGDA